MTTEYPSHAARRGPGSARRPDLAAWAGLWGRMVAPGVLLPEGDKTERRMVLVQWLIMPLVLAGCLLPLPRASDPPIHIFAAALVMAAHPLLYAVCSSVKMQGAEWRDMALTAADITVATLVFYATAARPGYAQVMLYCAVALAATRYTPPRAFGITSLVAFLLISALLLPLHVSAPTLASEIMGLYALTYLIGLLSQAEKTVGVTAIENARLAQTVLQRNRELSTLHRLARALNAETRADEILRLGLEGMAKALTLPGARIRIYHVQGAELRLVAHTGAAPHARDAVERHRRQEAHRSMAAGRTVVKGWRDDDDGTEDGSILYVTVPLAVRGTPAAVVQVDLSLGNVSMTPSMLETLEVFCGELAMALETAELRGEAHRTAILQEKNRIAQELHDTVLQMLFSIGLRLQWSLDRLPGDSDVAASLAEARHLSAQAGSELRSAIFTLRSDIAEIGLVPAVERLVDEQSAQAGWTANLITSGQAPPLPVLVQNAAHRVVREGLMNAYKHAGATDVVVSLRFDPASVTIAVQDNGVGIPAKILESYRRLPHHFGLRSVAEQVEELGGELAIYNNDEQGTAIKAVIPLDGHALLAA